MVERQARLRVLDHVANLIVPIVGVDRHDAGAQRVECVVVKEELGALIEQHRHTVPETVAGTGIGLLLLLDG